MAKNSQVVYYFEPIERQLGFAASVQQGNTLYLSGIVSIDDKLNVVGPGDMALQIATVYDHMERILAMSQANLGNVLSENIFTTDLAALSQSAAVRVARYARFAPPACTAVQVAALMLPGTVIEIQATAVLDR